MDRKIAVSLGSPIKYPITATIMATPNPIIFVFIAFNLAVILSILHLKLADDLFLKNMNIPRSIIRFLMP